MNAAQAKQILRDKYAGTENGDIEAFDFDAGYALDGWKSDPVYIATFTSGLTVTLDAVTATVRGKPINIFTDVN